ncbi:MAG: hypothetical protein ACRDMH_01230 [Solirubrobacterales bacterium]
MTELGELLQVIHDSRDAWSTFRGEYRLWQDRERRMKAFTTMTERSGGTSYAMVAVSSGDDAEQQSSTSEGRWRIWVQRPDSIREEIEGRDWGPETTVKIGEQWWSYDEYSGARTNEGSDEVGTSVARFSAWLEPARLLGSLRFEPLGATTIAGRQAIRTLAFPAEESALDEDRLDFELHGLGTPGEEYEFAVDLDTGTLLRVEARFGGQPVLIGEAEAVAFDEEFPPDTFVFTPPEGEEIEPLDFGRPSGDQPIHEAAAEAPFTVFMLPRIPEGWTMTAFSFPQSKRPKRGHLVGVSYHADTGAARLNLSQRARSEEGWAEHEDHWDYELAEHSGIQMKVHHRSDDVPQSMVLVTRDETDITISSEELSGDKLVEIAAELVPAPTKPPEL